jgi:uncharacterized protein (DUF2062 family)
MDARMASRWRDWIGAKMPTRAEMERNKYLAPIAHRFGRSELWRFTRRSVPRGVALGLFAGFIIPIGQIFLAAFLALPFRANVPLAALVTFVTNPFTLPFWLVVANRVGAFLLTDMGVAAVAGADGGWWAELDWFVQTAGVTTFGYLVLSFAAPVIGYIFAALGWRVLVARKWSRRRAAAGTALDPAE